MPYEFKHKPFSHQLEEFEAHGQNPMRGILWEQGTGKTKEAIDQACFLYEQGKIDAILILAPNGVHRNWLEDEIPAHVPDRLLDKVRGHFYQSPKAGTKWHKKACEAVLKHDGLAILAFSYSGFMTHRGSLFARRFLEKRSCFYALDETSGAIKGPGSKTTKRVIASGKYAPYRRIMDGTPITQGPFDIFAPMRFLDEKFWHTHGFPTFSSFKTYFGIWEKGYNRATEREFDFCVGYRNLEELGQIIDPYTSRVLKDDVLDLPPKLYSYRYFDPSAEQERLCAELLEQYMTELDGEFITAELAIVRMLRLQQILSGYITGEDGETLIPISGKNPRLETLVELADSLPHQAIIWAKFTEDINLICERLGGRAVRYDGKVSDDERAKSKAAFQAGDAQFFVGNPSAGATGLTLVQAKTVIYYNNSFKLRDRLQSEDRAHRIGQEHPVSYVDIVAPHTIDHLIVKALRRKFDVANQITGDKLREWIST